jgi:hypothetical protein
VFRLAAIAAGFLLVASTASAQGAPPAAAPAAPTSSLTNPEKLQRADEYLDRMKQVMKQVLKLLEEARNEKDVVKLNCVNEKLTQVKGLLRVSEQADISLQESVAKNEKDTADHEFQKISIAKTKVEQLRAEAEECIGQLAYVVDEKTTVEVETPKDLPDRDVTDREGPPPVVTRPPPASAFE